MKTINYSEFNELTNFREICMGNISRGLLYRGSYPVFKIDPERDRIYDKLVSDAKIACVLNLAGNDADVEVIADLVPWYNNLLKKGEIIGLDIQFDFDFSNTAENKLFRQGLRRGFQFLISHNGPYLIHCNAGIDRTGFVAAIIGLLCGADLDEVIYDYNLSYGKEFADANTLELNIINGSIIYDQLNTILKGAIDDSNNLLANIERYFLEDIGLTIGELSALRDILTRGITS